MEIQFSYIVTIYLLSAVATAALALVCRYRWKSPAAPYFTLLFAAATLWNLGDAGEFMSITPAAKFLCVCVEYPGMVIVPVAWFLILLYYTGNSRLITKKTLSLFLVIPVFTVAAVVTNPFHHLYYKEIISVVEQGTFVGIYLHGPLFWIFIAYSYGLLLVGLALIIARFWGSHAIYRTQMYLILLATAIPLLANLLYNTGGGPIPHVNFTPVLFALSGL
ncbi:MAG: histidine kinase N-terminal 7TM domain-containing protein, partial [Methanoregula sp.]